ncbi:MAG: hypothetical protein K2Q01_03750, partial [Rickettsiales bacterium]|nr:hypothetical protein [Rickettsiales bacterium]
LPQISVTPQEEAPVVMEAAPEPEIQPQAVPQTLPQTLALNTAPVPPAAPGITDASQGQTIVLQGQNEAIIGQMARIPMENEQITEIKPASDVDNGAGRELLSIINKY